ncbi:MULTISPECIES: heavy-metal-associated domain-containing protein [unclassified Pseudomonas]|uniref:heavy-metal-associated domain-containing protein n=1 Tax=unclassified Pseudomonas TaxID=196821 RepID=UPI000C86A78B|nr:hypothetical protein C1X90_17970 [Pseudomonas sp. GP01-A9]PMU28540.1 hypothetical protein C1X88_17620 [Pseudomonas sp. GP01-A13]PMU38792.1 hypothetical protein C1X89_15175 [Pseudomonas sp. GP01-A8]PMU52410.1 hypothetical protein C1X85_18730 [Pseudomonas sp. GP01-A6]PMU54407.1 hypothetical protein C1X87_06235 [Pseudomonas sp. GP01-A14]PMU61449.1 hypothetical protein C1X86_18005 [Pseudomonas sp. GP01-A3]PMU72923.1 hypothetical protein C1X84_18660 [Pseudomonas sp. GP01-A1]PMU73305.1 hypothet
MSCSNCVSKIIKAIQSLDNKATVSVDRNAGKVNVELTFWSLLSAQYLNQAFKCAI